MEAGSLKANPANWRKHPANQVAALRESIADVGWAGALLFNERTNRLIDGHARRDNAEPTELVPVLVGNWDAKQERRILATLDPITALAEPDPEALGKLLEGLTFDGEALAKLGQDLAREIVLPAIAPDPSEITDPPIPETPKRATTRRGDVWTLGNHRLVCGDCTTIGHTKQRADCIFTSPPYGVGVDYGVYQDTIENLRAMITTLAERWRRDVKPGGYAVINFGDIVSARRDLGTDEPCEYPMALDYWPPFRSAGWVLWSRRVWCKPAAGCGSMQCININRGATNWEHIWTWKAPGPALHDRQVSGSYASQHGWIDSSRTHQLGVKLSEHPAGMPVFVAAFIIAVHCREGFVLDPFAGSGTTMMAAEQLDRPCRAIELEPKYCDVIVERWQNLTGGKAKRVKP